MWAKVHAGWLLALAVISPAHLEECGVPRLKAVHVDNDQVSWEGGYEPSCLRGVEVCWQYPELRASACGLAPPDATSLRMKGAVPCARVVAGVTALGADYKNSDTWPGSGYAGPPEISGLKTTQKSSNVAELSWSSLRNFSCVTNVHLWICENKTEDLNACLFRNISPSSTAFEFHGVRICQNYYAIMKTIDKYANRTSALTTLPVYFDSATKVAKVRAANVTQSSALVRWWLSDVNATCQTEQMRLCYQENDTQTTPDCSSWTMDQSESSDALQLVDLAACTAYRVTVGLRTAISDSQRTATFTTPLHGEAIDAAVVNVSDTAAVVAWSFDADKRDCRPDSMQVCHAPVVGGNSSAVCHLLSSAASFVAVRHLEICTSYEVSLKLFTNVSPKPSRTLHLVTSSKGYPVLEHMKLTAVETTVKVDWAPVSTSLQCVRLYNVSWYSSGDVRKTWRTLPVATASFIIFAVSRGQTYYVEVAAVFVDGTTESLFEHVDIPTHSGSSRPAVRFFLFLWLLLLSVA